MGIGTTAITRRSIKVYKCSSIPLAGLGYSLRLTPKVGEAIKIPQDLNICSGLGGVRTRIRLGLVRQGEVSKKF